MSLSRRAFLALTAAATSRALPGFAGDLQTQYGTTSNGSLPRLPQAKFLEAADLSRLNGDEQALLVTLQGQVNRTKPRLYLYWGTDPIDQT